MGPCRIDLEPHRLRALVRSIVSQQISGTAARAIYKRLLAVLGPGGLSAEKLASLSVEQLRAAGLSSQKAVYLLDLARKIQEGHVRLNKLSRLPDHEVIENLVQVKGIGIWTAQMFLIFSLGRLDVFPHGDLGVQSAMKRLYGLKKLPDKKTGEAIAQAWRPYATVGSWYCWRSLELTKLVV